MGLLGYIIKNTVGKAVAGKVAEAGEKVCDKACEKLEEKSNQQVEKFFNEANGHTRLIVAQQPYTYKEKFQIYDEFENVKYVVEGKLVSATHRLTLFDSTGKNVLGRVKEKLISIRAPFSFEDKPQDFVIELNGQKLGKMKSRFALAKRKFEFTFNDWTLEGNVLGLKYKVLSGSETIMEVKETAFTTGDVYYIDIAKPENELICILILLAIDSSHTSKSDDNKRARRHHRLW